MRQDVIRLRPATMDDADFLLKVKNDKDVRAHSIVTHDKIKKRNHMKWLRERLTDGKTALFVIYKDGKMAGDVRFDGGRETEISIRLLPQFRQKGIATAIVRTLSFPGMMAKVVEGNIPSLNVFVTSGYKFRSYKDGAYILEKS